MSDWKKAIYDPDKGEYFGRTPKNWWKLLVFYTIFYIVLAALVSVCMSGLVGSLDDLEPKWKLSDSIIGTNPGLGFRPISDNPDEGSLIRYVRDDPKKMAKWVKLLDEFLQPYNTNQTGQNYQKCSFDKPPVSGHVCTVDVRHFGPCTPENNYGYNSSSPCVFLKLNRIYGWIPQVYTEPVDGMPSDLNETISSQINEEQIWISCQGEGPVDRENVAGFRYYPTRGFPGYYYPYLNIRNYLSPIIAVQVVSPTPDMIINVECRAWAKNIHYQGGNEREGSVRFEIMYDLV